MSDFRVIYVCGPHAGPSHKNKAAFDFAEELITKAKKTPISYLKALKNFDDFEALTFIRLRLMSLLECDLLITLQGWEEDKDCILEVSLARMLNIPVVVSERYMRELKFQIENLIDNPANEK